MTRQATLTLTLILSLLAALAATALLYYLGPDWTHYAPASCLLTHCFCETPRSQSLILQPSNSWSSFAFVVVGFWMALAGGRKSATPFSGFAVNWFALTAIIIGVGSFFLHATLTLWGQFLDVLGMYLFSAFTLTYAFRRWRAHSNTQSLLLYCVLSIVLIGLLITLPETRRWLFAVVLIADIAVEMLFARPLRPCVRVRWYMWGIALQSIAFMIWIVDQSRTWCHGASLLQGHATWHLLNAAAVYCSYLYYRSERAKS